jgi:hypothetical protein
MARTIAVSPEIAELAALAPVHYRESFAVDTTGTLSPQAGGRRAREGAPAAMRETMLRGWRVLGVRLAPLGSPGQVLGWPIRSNDERAIVMGIESRVGITARLVIAAEPGRLVQAMLVRFEHVGARAAWAAIGPFHRPFVRRLLDLAAQHAAASANVK